MNVAFYWILAWYLDNVLPDAFGSRRPFYFFLLPSYWGLVKNGTKTVQDQWLQLYKDLSENEENEDDDVAAERAMALSGNNWPAVKVVNLRKVYGKPLFKGLVGKGSPKTAVKNSCITFQEGQLYVLLILRR